MSRFCGLVKQCRSCGVVTEVECVSCYFCDAERRAEEKLLEEAMRATRSIDVRSRSRRKRDRKVTRETHQRYDSDSNTTTQGLRESDLAAK